MRLLVLGAGRYADATYTATLRAAGAPEHGRVLVDLPAIHVVGRRPSSDVTGVVIAPLPSGATAAKPGPSTLRAEADGAALAGLIAVNRNHLVKQNMREKGHDQSRAEAEIDLAAALLRYLGRGTMTIKDAADLWRLDLEFKP